MINLNILLIFIILCSTVGIQYKNSDVRLVPYLGGMCPVPPNIFAAKWTTVVPRSASLATVTQCVSFCHGECFSFFMHCCWCCRSWSVHSARRLTVDTASLRGTDKPD